MKMLLGLEVTWTAEGQAEVAEVAEGHEAQGAEKVDTMLRQIAAAVTPGARGVTGTLPLETVQEVYRLANLLGLQVTLSAREDWGPKDSERLQTQDPAKWPVMSFSFQPEQVLQSQPVSGVTP